MPIELITALTVIVFGALGLVLVMGWIIGTWREELARNRDLDKQKPPRVGSTHISVASDVETQHQSFAGYGH
jgi:hypothetical protein